MKRRTFLKHVASVIAYSVIPSFAIGKALDASIYIPEGTEIREIGTNDLIAVVKNDIYTGSTQSIHSFNWVWPSPKTGDVISYSIAEACENAAINYRKQVLSQSLPNSPIMV